MLRKCSCLGKFRPIRLQCIRNLCMPPDIKRLPKHIQDDIEASKEKLKWRVPLSDRSDTWNSKLNVFDGEGEQNSDFISIMQQPIDLSPKSVKAWWKKRNEKIERQLQQYVPERHAMLGSNLAAAHFITYRGGSVKFLHKKEWIKSDEDLPRKYDAQYEVEAIRCDNMLLYYEGLENIRRLKHMKFLSFHNVKTFDDWCLDRVSGSENDNLEVLDISGTSITEKGLSCLYRVKSLKVLIVDDPKASPAFELSSALLEECIPLLKICPSKNIH